MKDATIIDAAIKSKEIDATIRMIQLLEQIEENTRKV